MAKDFYKTLEVPRGSSDDEIKRSYRKLARKYHPDVNQENPKAEEKFKEISHAYDILSDSKKKKLYDSYGEDGLKAGFGGNPFGGRGGGRGAPQGFESIFGGPGGGGGGAAFDLGDLLGGMFGGGARQPQQAQQPRTAQNGEDIDHVLKLDFNSAFEGTTAEVSFTSKIIAGPRLVDRARKIKVRIPAGASSGRKIRLKGKGHASARGGAAGDLVIELKVEAHPYFVMDGKKILLNVPISVSEALLGAKVEVPTMMGSIFIKIPAGSSSGKKLRLRGKGIDGKNGRGDQILTLQVMVPDKLDRKSRGFIKSFQERNPQADLRAAFASEDAET